MNKKKERNTFFLKKYLGIINLGGNIAKIWHVIVDSVAMRGRLLPLLPFIWLLLLLHGTKHRCGGIVMTFITIVHARD
jgi:hypothetical protein